MGHRLILGASVIAALAVTALQPVHAQDAVAAAMAAIAGEVGKNHGDLDKMKTEEKNLDKTKAKLDKEAKRLATEQKNLPTEAAKFDLDQKSADNFKASLIAMGCRPGEQAPIALTNMCNPKIAQFNAIQGELNIRGPKILARGKQYSIDRQKLSDDTVKWSMDTTRVRNKISELQTTITALEARYAVCPGLSPHPSREELKLRCGNVQFDGAEPTLPACITPACLQFDALFGRK